MSVKSIADEAFGTATTMAFAIPEAGPGIAAMLALGNFIFDMCFPPGPPDAGTPPPPPPATREDLENAVLAITDAIFSDSKHTIAAELAGQADDFDDNLDLFTKHFVPGFMGTAAGQAVMTQDTLDNLKAYLTYDAPGSTWKNLAVVIQWVEQSRAVDRNASIGMYALSASLSVNYLKLVFAWELRRTIDADKASGALSAVMGDPKDASVIAAREDFLRTSPCASLLHHIDDWVKYAQDWVDDITPSSDAIDRVAPRSQFFGPGHSREYSEIAYRSACAAARTQLIQEQGVEEDDLNAIAGCIPIWRDARTNLTAPPVKV